MTKIPQASDPTTKFDLVYDAWNRLVEVKNHSGTTVTTNEYDGLNRRIVRDETGGNGKKTHYYYNSQWQVLEERIEAGGVIDPDPLAQYLYHPHYVDSIAMRRYDANTDGLNVEEHFYLQDANFNVTAVTDDTGAVVERYSYTPYGEVTVLDSSFVLRNSSLISNEIQYTGRRRDPETGLQLNRNRFYASHLGRWVNRDPIGYRGGTLNLYGYVNFNPVSFIDPLGLHPDIPDQCPPCKVKSDAKAYTACMDRAEKLYDDTLLIAYQDYEKEIKALENQWGVAQARCRKQCRGGWFEEICYESCRAAAGTWYQAGRKGAYIKLLGMIAITKDFWVADGKKCHFKYPCAKYIGRL